MRSKIDFFFFFFFTSDRSIMTHTQLNESLHCSGPASGTEHLSMPVNEIHDCGKKKRKKKKREIVILLLLVALYFLPINVTTD